MEFKRKNKTKLTQQPTGGSDSRTGWTTML